MKRAIIAVVAVLAWGGAREARAVLLPVNSSTVVHDGIEYYIQTDKAVYDLGEDVEVLFRITNLTEDVWSRSGPCSIMNAVVTSTQQGAETILWGEPFACGSHSQILTLATQESMEIDLAWPQIDEYYVSVPPGRYEVIGTIFYKSNAVIVEDHPVSVEVTVIPEPATMTILAYGLTLLVLKRK